MSWFNPFASGYGGAEVEGSYPVELYTFAAGQSMWRYTSANVAITTPAGLTYEPAVISRDRAERTTESRGGRLTVYAARTLPPVVAMRDIMAVPMWLAVHRYHMTAGTFDYLALLHYGEVAGVSLDGAEAELTVVGVEQVFERTIPRPVIARQCQWAVYSSMCGVNPLAFRYDTTLVSGYRAGIVVASINGVADGYYAGGVIAFPPLHGDLNTHWLQCNEQVGAHLTLFGTLPSHILPGDPVQLYAGCDKTVETCVGTFNNVRHFSGFPQLPIKNPMVKGLSR